MRNKRKAESEKLKAKNKKGKTKILKRRGALGQVKTEWDLAQLYKSEAELDRHLDKIENAYRGFAKRYKDKDFTSTEEKLLKALKDFDAVANIVPSKPGFYLGMSNSLNSSDQKIESKLNLISQRLAKLSNQVLFFSIKIGKIEKKKQKAYLASKKLLGYKYLLERIFLTARYDLSEKEEQIANLLSLPGYDMWVRGVQKAQNKLEVSFKGKKLPLSEALEKTKSTISTKDRRLLWNNIITELKKVADFSETEMNAVITSHKISDELRGFEKPYSSTVLSYENTEKEVLALMQTVTENFPMSHKFYSIKSKALGFDDMKYVDRLADLGVLKRKFDFAGSTNILLRSLDNADKEFGDILRKMLSGARIDVFPRRGKRGGAFCAGEVNIPTFVMLNHTDDFNSLTTFAHEMGHAIHTELSKVQPARYQGYTTSVAEVASTFFENILFYEIYDTLSDEEKLIAMHEKLDGSMATIFRQTAFFNFELELHNEIRAKGAVSHEEISSMLAKHLKSYLGKSVKVEGDDGYSFIFVPHFRSIFYVYSYVYGEIISDALYQRYRSDKNYIKEIKKFLSAGGSRSPYDIFKEIGINTREPRFWENGLRKIEGEVKEFETLIKKNK